MGFRVWVIYDHPRDFPDNYVVRLQTATGEGIVVSPEAYLATDLEDARNYCRERTGGDCYPISRHPDDDPVIVECWA